MAKSYTLDQSARTILIALHDVARTPCADVLDRVALAAALDAADALATWAGDHRELSRALAARRAGLVAGLCHPAVSGWRNPMRRALAALSLAMTSATDGEANAAAMVRNLSRAALDAAHAQAKAAPQRVRAAA